MNLHRLLLQRAAEHRPLSVALIGAGKFGSMFLSQVPRTPGIHLVALADLNVNRARESLARVGWQEDRY
ncbi:MAG TPA: flagellar biosynthesis protein FlgA, partial [Burkholderiales bacterium]|nr:flagellar biosynthesis protein FlgA [Burkholderiales bacterium]